MIRTAANIEFARLTPGARAEGRTIELPPLCRPTAFNQQQTGTGTERGRARGVMCRFALAVAQDWSVIRGRAGFIIDRGSHPLAVCGTTRAGRPFVVGRFPAVGWLRGGSSRRLAINIKTLGRRDVQSLAQGHPSHFIASNRYGPEPSDGGLRSVPKQAGEFPKKQGERQHVSCV